MYDLSTLLTTIAAISATIVAILGGFIFTRHSTLASQRNSLNKQIDSTREIIRSLEKDKTELETRFKNFEFVAFLTYVTGECLRDQVLVDIDLEGNVPQVDKYSDYWHYLNKTELPDYWHMAQQICDEIRNLPETKAFNTGELGIPKTLVRKYQNDKLKYMICAALSATMIHQRNPQIQIWPEINSIRGTFALFYSGFLEEINEKAADVKEQNDVLDSLEKDKYADDISDKIKAGLIIFSLVILFCVIAPVYHIQFTTDSKLIYNVLKYGFLSIFSAGIIAIFVYLILLVKDMGRKKSHNNPKGKTDKNTIGRFTDNSRDS